MQMGAGKKKALFRWSAGERFRGRGFRWGRRYGGEHPHRRRGRTCM